jgi:hypothetical protein
MNLQQAKGRKGLMRLKQLSKQSLTNANPKQLLALQVVVMPQRSLTQTVKSLRVLKRRKSWLVLRSYSPATLTHSRVRMTQKSNKSKSLSKPHTILRSSLFTLKRAKGPKSLSMRK